MSSKAGWLSGEPFVLFLLIAAAIFAADSLVSRGQKGIGPDVAPAFESGPIMVTTDAVDQLREQFMWLYDREPDAAETELLVQGWIADEVVFREGLALGMHRSDAKIRSMIIDKVRLLWAAAPGEPDDETLLAYYIENIGRYYSEPRISFEQVFFEAPPDQDEQLLAALRAGEDVSGDEFWLGERLADYSESILRNSFGGAFYQAMIALPVNRWHGPLTSAHGTHFLRVLESVPSAPLPYAEIRARIAEDWAQGQRAADIARQTREARRKYPVLRRDEA
ncbi:MAG: peptidyl-prolyl cis-trans isomerase [Chromatocurvus sp.]